jgi:hypothetical protein
MPTKTWKKNELSWNKIGAHRNHFEAEDCSHPLFSIECKLRQIQNYPKTLRNWFEQAKANAAEGKIPLLAIHLSGEIRGNDLVVLKRSDFEDLMGRLNPDPSRLSGPGGLNDVKGIPEAGGSENGEN